MRPHLVLAASLCAWLASYVHAESIAEKVRSRAASSRRRKPALPFAVQPSGDLDAASARDMLTQLQAAAQQSRPETQQQQQQPEHPPGFGSALPDVHGSGVQQPKFDGGAQRRLAWEAAEPSSTLVLRVPLGPLTVTAALVVVSLACVGAAFLWRLTSVPACHCPLCEGEYVLERRLGSGGFGTVFLVREPGETPAATASLLPPAVPPPPTGEQFVLKMIPATDAHQASLAQAEARDLRALRHPGVVRYEQDFLHFTPERLQKHSRLYVCIVMEHCEMDARTFIERLRRRGEVVPEALVLRIGGQLADVLRYCHAHNLVHRDIKSQNVFLTRDGHVRLGDFGLAREMRTHLATHTDAGTDGYKPPEALLGGRRDARAGDVWGLGLFLLELTSRQFIWERPGVAAGETLQSGERATQALVSGIPSQHYSSGLIALVKSCLAAKPQARPTAAQIARSKLLKRGAARALRRAAAAARAGGRGKGSKAGWGKFSWQPQAKQGSRGSGQGWTPVSPTPSGSVEDSPLADGSSSDGRGEAAPWLLEGGRIDLSALAHDPSSSSEDAGGDSGLQPPAADSAGRPMVDAHSGTSSSSAEHVASRHQATAPSSSGKAGEAAAVEAAVSLQAPAPGQGSWQRVTRRRRRRR